MATKAGHPAPQVVKVQPDVLDKESVKNAAQKIEKEFGPGGVDILVNNAGWLETFHLMGDIDVDDWWYTWEINVKGLFLVTQTFLPLVLKSKEKTIVNLSSISAHLTAPGVSVATHVFSLQFEESNGVITMTGVRVSFGQACRIASDGVHERTSLPTRFSPSDSFCVQADYGAQGLLAYAVHPGAVLTDIGLHAPTELRHLFIDTPALSGDCIAFLTRERTEWLAGRYISCEYLDTCAFLAHKGQL